MSISGSEVAMPRKITLANIRNTKLIAVSAVILVALVGSWLILQTRAATPVASFEAETATVTGNATKAADTNASGGQAVTFSSGVPTGPSTPILPTFSGTCPTLANGQVSFPDNRIVHIRMDSNPSTKGPLIFLWHGQQTADTTDADANTIGNTLLTNTTLNSLVSAGAVIAIMKMHTASTWDNANSWSTSNRDLTLVDTVVACTNAQAQIEPSRIHAIGMSWGGYQTSHLVYLRSNYFASVVVQSGGTSGTPVIQRSTNNFATIVGYGGSGDLATIRTPTFNYRDIAKAQGHSVIYCEHTAGHVPIPGGGPMHARFFQDHPYGVANAYTGSLPIPPFMSYCAKY